MNQDSSINNITTAQNITQTITNRDVPPTSKENIKSKPHIKNESNTICWESAEQIENPKMNLILSAENLWNRLKILNLKENQS